MTHHELVRPLEWVFAALSYFQIDGIDPIPVQFQKTATVLGDRQALIWPPGR
jgi:hypothetical protein